MLLNNAPANEAVLSNVGEIGDFKIKASAKAFNILSSGLYANKIRAIIRELSCNAVDSHVAAGKADTPFDIHLPNQMEPWFSIRDYGTGLSHEQIVSIYTTYFESTKTDSNDFIGALGLGSKSPFSYTDNFTVTAIKDGKKGIYSAFINGDGVPSIAQMMTEDTTEPNGIEIKMSVNDQYDFRKFRDEARTVYTHFKLRPVISGARDFDFYEVEYDTRDIIPGVHSMKNEYHSVAVMGNIAYPIDVPNASDNLGQLYNLVRCGLELHFDIGELDFQASREGLSYIPSTIAAIKSKLEAVNAVLATRVAEEANAIENLWERALLLAKKKDSELWSAAVTKYITDTNFELIEIRNNYLRLSTFKLLTADLASKYNINIHWFSKYRGESTCHNHKAATESYKDAAGVYAQRQYWDIMVDAGARFVLNDTKVGATERAKFHWKNTPADMHCQHVYVLEPADKTKPMLTKPFFKAIKNPPTSWIQNASGLMQKDRKQGSTGKNATILKLQEKGYGGYYAQREMVWRDAGKSDSFDATQTYYYLPMSGFTVDCPTMGKDFSAKNFIKDLKDSGFAELDIPIYGVRKTDIEFIKTQPNWKPVSAYIADVLTNASQSKKLSLAMSLLDRSSLLQYNSNIVRLVDSASPYAVAMDKLKDTTRVTCSEWSIKRLCSRFNAQFDISQLQESIVSENKELIERYPLLNSLTHCGNSEAIAEYINLIDEKKGIQKCLIHI
ncbi:hypothetical protein UFOVP181_209 [uncultured Caudovirales phage]|uniref:Uncharacterized protein n=1 Tax=uncultured Caudovirales phage TaxID=2100421 RepID=A0A6J5L1X5_9CAUD|nr:hypothetical protein UFOVP57_430 [uncultured Caudovirales phage]CAB5208840.1 hypothetical protein UFOVP181_209 [uncultured Caudovirales phage]